MTEKEPMESILPMHPRLRFGVTTMLDAPFEMRTTRYGKGELCIGLTRDDLIEARDQINKLLGEPLVPK